MILVSRIFLSAYKYKRKLCTTIKYSTKTEYSPSKLKILFFGTDNFSLPSLSTLNKSRNDHSKISSLGVVTSFKSPANEVKTYADREKLPLYRWPLQVEQCQSYDLGVVVSFGHLIPQPIIESFPLGMINVHASLLPRWRGAAPIIYSIMKGDHKTGVTIMRIAPKHFDIGDIFAQQEVNISDTCLMPQLHEELAKVGADLLLKTIEEYPNSFKNTWKQNNSLVTHAPKINASMAEIRWTEMSAREIYNLYRSLYSYKHLTTTFDGVNVKFVEIRYSSDTQDAAGFEKPGHAKYIKKRKCISVMCNDGQLIDILALRVEGKKVMNAMDFNNGFLKKSTNQDCCFK